MAINSKIPDLPDDALRREIKQLADSVRIKYGIKGISDILDILNNAAFLIRKPIDTKKLSGFTTYIDGEFVIFLNSSFTLGHERFSGAHELYHVECNKDILKREKMVFDEHEDIKANIFAAEFLMPEDYVREMFYKLINKDKEKIEAKHIIKMNTFFKASYAAMLKMLIQLDLCDASRYEYLREYASLDNKLKLQELTRKEGLDISLIVPSYITSIPKEYLEIVKQNYETEKISFGKLQQLLNLVKLSPVDIGCEPPQEDKWV